MKKFVAMAIAVLALGSSTLAAGDINVTVETSKQGQIKTKAKEFRFSQSPRDLATGQAADRRRLHEPIVIVKEVDSTSQFFVQAAAKGELLPAVLFEFTRTVSDGKAEVYQTVKLTNAIISSVKMVNGNGGNRPTQEITFTFQKIEYEHKQGKTAATDSWMLRP